MSKYDLMKNVYKKNSQNQTGSSEKVTTQEITQPKVNKQAAKTQGRGNRTESTVNGKKKSTSRYEDYTDVAREGGYSQASEGVKALSEGRNVETAIREFTDKNKDLIAKERANALQKAAKAQEQIDTNRKYIDSNKALKAVSDTGLSFLGGLTSGIGGQFRVGSNIAQGIGGLTGNQDLVRKAQEFDRELGIEGAIRNVNKNNMVANNMVGQIASSIGNMIPTIATTALSGGSNALGLGVMGASVFGNAGSQAFNNLSRDGELSKADAARALGYGGLSAALEVGTEQLSSLFPGLDTFAFTNPNHLLGQAGGEALEEMVSSALEPLINPLADPNVRNTQQYGESVKQNTIGDLGGYAKDIGYSGLLGGLTSVVMGIPACVNGLNSQNAQERADNYRRIHESLAELEEAGNMAKTDEQRAEIEKVLNGIENFILDNVKMFNWDEATMLLNEINQKHAISNPVNAVSETAEATASQQMPEPVQPVQPVEPVQPIQPTENITPVQPVEPTQEIKTPEPVTDMPQAEIEDLEYITELSQPYKADGNIQPITAETTEQVENSYNNQLANVAADTQNIPPQDIDALTGKFKITKGAITKSEGRGGAHQENVSEATAKEYQTKTENFTKDVAYAETSLKKLTQNSVQKYNQLGEEGLYNDFMSFDPSVTGITGIFKALGDMVGISNNYEFNQHVSDGQYVADRMEVKKADLMDALKKANIDTEIIVSPSGQATVKATQDGKVVDTDQVKELNDIIGKLDKVYTKLNNISHSAALILRQSWFKKLTPAAQIDGFKKNVDKINDELRKKFKGQFTSGSISPVEIDEELIKEYLHATTDEERADIMEQMAANVAEQIPHSLIDKIDAIRYNNMLFNPTTFMRNTIGNFTQDNIAKIKDMNLYLIESAEKLMGRVRYNTLDENSVDDQQLLRHSEKNANDLLTNDFADAKKSGHTRKYLKDLGYSGKLLNTLAWYKGDTYSLSKVDPYFYRRFNEGVAINAKNAGYTIDENNKLSKDGKPLTDAQYRELVNKSFTDAKRQWLDSESLRAAKADSAGMARASRSQYNLAKSEIFDILNPDHESIAGLLNNNVSSDSAFRRRVNQIHRSQTFSNKNVVGKALNAEQRAVNYMMNESSFFGDDGFLRRGYGRNMARMLDSQGYHAEVEDGEIKLFDREGNQVAQGEADGILKRLNASAYQEALENTYHDANAIADILNQAKRESGLVKFILDAELPFTKTPFNIARRAIEYSPMGLLTSLAKVNQVQNGSLSPEAFLNNIAKGATGTSAMLIGMWLASLGLLRGKGKEEDDRLNSYEKANGIQDYAINLPNGDSISVDWLAPGITPFILGARMQEIHEGYNVADESALSKTWNIFVNDVGSFGSLFEPIADSTYLSGLQDTLSELGEDGIEGALRAGVTNYVKQFTPVVGSKIAGIVDPTKYSTYSNNYFDKMLRSAAVNFRLIDLAMGRMKNSPYLQPQLDQNGDVVQTEDYGLGAAGRALTNLVFPFTYKKNEVDDIDKELERLYKDTGQSALLAQQQYYYDNQKFTPEERTEYNQYFLSEYRDNAEAFIKSDMYNDYTDEERAAILRAMSSHFKTEANAKYLGRIIPNTDKVLTDRDKACDLLTTLGAEPYQYYGYINTKSDKDKNGDTINNTKAMKVRAQMEADGIYDDVIKAYNDGKIKKLSDYGLNQTVCGWSQKEWVAYYEELVDGKYGISKKKKDTERKKIDLVNGVEKSSKKKTNTSKKSGGTSSRKGTRTYGRSSGSSVKASSSDPTSILSSGISKALTAGKKNTTGIQTKVKGTSSAQELYNQIMTSHKSNLNKARKYTKA